MPKINEAFIGLLSLAFKGSICHPLSFLLGSGAVKLSLMN